MKRTVVTIIDDLTGEPGAHRHVIEIDGVSVAVDLTDDAYAALIQALQPFIDAATPIRGTRAPRAPHTHAPLPVQRRVQLPPGASAADVRRWWKAQAGDADRPLPPFSTNGRVPTLVWEHWRSQVRQVTE